MSKIKLVLSAMIGLCLMNFAYADIPTPSPPNDYKSPKEVRIIVSKDYPDYKIYLVSYSTLPPKTQPERFNPKIDESTFQYFPIELTTKTPLVKNYSEFNYRGLVAVKNDLVGQINPGKMLAAVKTKHDSGAITDGIYFNYLNSKTNELHGSYIVINEVTEINKDGLQTKTYSGDKSQLCFGLLFSIGIVLIGIFFFRKKGGNK